MAWRVSTAWFTRDTVFLAAPVGTMAEIRFTPGKNDWETLLSYFGDTPLISGRALSLRNIAPITNGEFAVFIGEDGRTSVAIRSKGIPEDMLDSMGIVVQSPSKTVYLLSDRILPLQTDPSSPNGISRLIRTQDGELRLFPKGEGKSVSYPIRLSHEALSIRLNGEKTVAAPWKFIPEGTLLALSTPEWTENETLPILSQVTEVWGERIKEVFSPILDKQGKKSSLFLWRGSAEGKPILISGDTSEDPSGLQAVLRVLAAASEPNTRTLTLPDTTNVKEWYADPSSVSVETLTRSGVPVYRAVGDLSTYFAAQKEGRFVLTNTDAALSLWLGEPDKEAKPLSCSYALYADLSTYEDGVRNTLQLNTPNLFSLFVNELPYLRIEAGSNPWMRFTKERCG